jgi:hypothetical protein
MSLAVQDKAPTDRIDYDIGFNRWLTDGDQVQSATASVEDATVTFTLDGVFNSADAVKVWVIGGIVGEQSEIFVDATTQYGRTKRACFTMRIRDC